MSLMDLPFLNRSRERIQDVVAQQEQIILHYLKQYLDLFRDELQRLVTQEFVSKRERQTRRELMVALMKEHLPHFLAGCQRILGLKDSLSSLAKAKLPSKHETVELVFCRRLELEFEDIEKAFHREARSAISDAYALPEDTVQNNIPLFKQNERSAREAYALLLHRGKKDEVWGSVSDLVSGGKDVDAEYLSEQFPEATARFEELRQQDTFTLIDGLAKFFDDPVIQQEFSGLQREDRESWQRKIVSCLRDALGWRLSDQRPSREVISAAEADYGANRSQLPQVIEQTIVSEEEENQSQLRTYQYVETFFLGLSRYSKGLETEADYQIAFLEFIPDKIRRDILQTKTVGDLRALLENLRRKSQFIKDFKQDPEKLHAFGLSADMAFSRAFRRLLISIEKTLRVTEELEQNDEDDLATFWQHELSNAILALSKKMGQSEVSREEIRQQCTSDLIAEENRLEVVKIAYKGWLRMYRAGGVKALLKRLDTVVHLFGLDKQNVTNFDREALGGLKAALKEGLRGTYDRLSQEAGRGQDPLWGYMLQDPALYKLSVPSSVLPLAA